MIGENKEEDIKKFSEEAFSLARGDDDDPKKSIAMLCKLRAVGPATASGEFLTILFKCYKFAFLGL